MSTLLQKWTSKRSKTKPISRYPWSQQKLRNSQRTLPRYGHSAISHPQHGLIIYGGKHKGHAKKDLFSINTGTMTTHIIPSCGDLPAQRMYTTLALIDNFVALYGGEPLSSTQQWDPCMYLLNLSTNRWVRSSSHHIHERSGHSMVSNNNILYIWGGKRSSKVYLNDMCIVQVRNGKYAGYRCITFLPELAPTSRSNHCSVMVDNKIFIFGGGNHQQLFNDIWSYDIQKNTWYCIPATGFIPSPRHYCAVSLVNGVIYVHGGINEHGQEIQDLYGFKIKNSRWYMFQNMGKAPSARYGHTMTPVGSKLYVIGDGHEDLSVKPDDPLTIHVLDNDIISYPPDSEESSIYINNQRRHSSPILPPSDRPPDSSFDTTNLRPPISESTAIPSSPLDLLAHPTLSLSTPAPTSIQKSTPSRSSSLRATPLVSPTCSSPNNQTCHSPKTATTPTKSLAINNVLASNKDKSLPLVWSTYTSANGSTTTIRPISTLAPRNSHVSVNDAPIPANHLKERSMLIQQIKSRDLTITEMKNKEHRWRTLVAKARGIDKQPMDIDLDNELNLICFSPDTGMSDNDDPFATRCLNDQQIKRLLFEQLVQTKTEARHIKRDIDSACRPICVKLDQEERIQLEALNEADHYRTLCEALAHQNQQRTSDDNDDYHAEQQRRVTDLENKLANVMQENTAMMSTLTNIQNDYQTSEQQYQVILDRLDKEHRRARRAQAAYDATLKRLSILQQRTRTNEKKNLVNEHHIRLLNEQIESAQSQLQQQSNSRITVATTEGEALARWERKNEEQSHIVSTLQQQLANTSHLVRCLQTDLKKSTCDWSNIVNKLEITRAEIRTLVTWM
ncbi:hypothetical protein BC941DRAFT_377122 [Chlamydoabsidia padenii]|nr:hypothetical protein BC941DRAFT_377122 [Chlamydoabsidia padenii]